MGYAVDWVDAFTDQAFGGNGCAVVHDAATLTAETCMAFVRETSLVECTFVESSAQADFKVRYFVADREIPFAGHPTIATVASLLHRGMVSGASLVLETGAGLVKVELDGPLIIMTQPAPVFGAEVPREAVADVVGLAADDLVGQPQVVSTGLPFCIAVVRSRAVLDAAVLDLAQQAAFRAKWSTPELPVFEPYLVVLEGATPKGNTFARLLMPPPLPAEDPFTGSATGAAAAYLWARGMIRSHSFIAEQGHGLGRPGQAQVEVLGPPTAVTGVKVGGTAHVLMSGELFL